MEYETGIRSLWNEKSRGIWNWKPCLWNEKSIRIPWNEMSIETVNSLKLRFYLKTGQVVSNVKSEIKVFRMRTQSMYQNARSIPEKKYIIQNICQIESLILAPMALHRHGAPPNFCNFQRLFTSGGRLVCKKSTNYYWNHASLYIA